MLLRVLGPVRPACLDLVGDAAVGSVVSRGAVLLLKFMPENLITRSASLLGGTAQDREVRHPDGTSYLSLISAALSSPPPISRPQRAWTGPP